MEQGSFQQAANAYDHAKEIDDGFAELRFRRGQCALALRDPRAAQTNFAAARDLDALRFRCDSRLNAIIRQQPKDEVRLVDGERALAEASPDGIPGAEFFYEHVHLTFQGNYILARAIAENIEQTLGFSGVALWPEAGECARRLGYTERDTQIALSAILGRLGDAPFTFQANHEEQVSRLVANAHELPAPNSTASLQEAQSTVELALARWPEDAELWEQSGEIKQAHGDYAGALAAARHSVEQIPSNTEGWLLCGTVLAQQGKYEEAATAFQRVFELDPEAVWARHNFALCLEKLGHRDEAIAEFKRTLKLRPRYGTGWLALGQLYEEIGRTNDAEQCYGRALTNRVNQADDLASLARFCLSRRWFGLAVTNFTAAIELSPSNPGLRMGVGRALVALGRHDEAVQQYQAAVELDADQVQPHMQLGVEFGRLRKPALAEKEFREVLRLNPNLIEARVNLGIALYEQEKPDDALKQFEDVLQRNPGDATALRYAQRLRNPAALPVGR